MSPDDDSAARSQPPDTVSLHYGAPVRSDRRRILRPALRICGVLTLIAVLVAGYVSEQGGVTCRDCGAYRHYDWVSWYGIPLHRSSRVQVNALSEFVQARSGGPCRHSWQFYSAERTAIPAGVRMSGPGEAIRRVVLAGRFESLASVGDLDRMATEDPTFHPRLRQVISNPSEANLEWMDELEALLQSRYSWPAASSTAED